MKLAWKSLKSAVKNFMEDRALRLSAALAYYSIFSIGPLLVLIVGIVGLLFGEETVRREMGRQLQELVGPKAAQTVEQMMTAQQKNGSLMATILGAIALVFGASGVFGQLQDALNTIWEVKPKPGQGISGFIRNRFLSLAMVLGTGFLLLVSMVLTTFVAAFAGFIGKVISMPDWTIHIFNSVASFAVISLLFAMIFKFLPDVEVQWRDIWVGAIGTALLFTAGKYLLGLYLGRESTASAYGAASSVVVVLMYIYYSSVILFFGAEFTRVYARQAGSRIVPRSHAVPVTEEERAQQGMPRSEKIKAEARKSEEPAPAGQEPVGAATSMKSETQPNSEEHAAHGPFPGEVLRERPWTFMGLALALGLAGSFMVKSKIVRRILRFYRMAFH